MQNVYLFNAWNWVDAQFLERILQLFVISCVAVDSLLLPADGTLR